MRKAKLILPLALLIVVAVVAVSMADGGGDGESPTKAGWTSYAPLAERDRGRAHDRGRAVDPDLAGVVAQVRNAAAKEAPDVAEPVISRSEKAGNITAGQADELRSAAQGLADGKSPRELAPTVDLRDWDVRVVIRDAFEALSRRAPDLAKPIIDDAVKSGEITESQAAEIRDRIATGHRFGGGMRDGRCHKPDREVESRAPLDSSV
jgi:hypothetical protein